MTSPAQHDNHGASPEGVPSAAEFYEAILDLLKLRAPRDLTDAERARIINSAIDLVERMDAIGGANAAYVSFTDGMQAAAEICGTLAETTYDDSDGFAAATGCEAAIIRVVREQRREQRA